MEAHLGGLDICLFVLYAVALVGMGIYSLRKTRTAEQFMVAGRNIPAWAAGIAVMSAYTSSISYIAVPGRAYDDNWHPMIFALCIPPVAWIVCRYVVPYYRKTKIISVYAFLEDRLGPWARIYAAFSFVLYMIGRAAVILYLASLLLCTFVPWDITLVILAIGLITIVYTLLGGMEAVIWTDVLQSIIMIGGLLFCVVSISRFVLGPPEHLLANMASSGKFSFGSTDFSFSSRTIWVMIIYGVTENLRNLIADQNYVQKYCAVPDERAAKRSVWISMLLYIPLTPIFLYIGTGLYAFYSSGQVNLPPEINKGDQVFPYYIATQIPAGLKGLVISAVLAAAMSTVDSALNCSATVLFLDFFKRFINPGVSEKTSVFFLRLVTVIWGLLSIFFALLMIRARSALEVWWQISGIFGGGILGLFILALLRVCIKRWQGIAAVLASIAAISWVTFARDLPEDWKWAQCAIDPILAGACGVGLLVAAGLLFAALTKTAKERVQTRETQA